MSLKALVVVPTYNEFDNIDQLLAGVRRHVPDAHILFVDDNSQDGTQGLIAEHRQRDPNNIFLLQRAAKLGLGTAYVAAFKWALARDYQVIVEMDADGSHRPEDLARILQAAPEHPVVIGSRYIKGGGTQNWSFQRRLISRAGSLYARTILGLKTRDLTGGFNAWQRHVLMAIGPDNLRSEGYTFQIEMKFRAHLAGYELFESPILFVERRAGKSKMSGGIVREAIFRIWVLAAQRYKIHRELARVQRSVVASKAASGESEAR